MTSSSLKQLKANGIVGQSRQGVITSPKGSTNIMDLHFPNYLVDATTSLKETKDTRRPLAKEMAKFGSLAQDSLGFAGESYRNDMRVLRPAKKDGKRDESLGRGMKKGWIDNPNGDFDDILLKTNKRPPGAGQTPSFIHKPAPLEDEILNIRYSYEIDIQVKKGKGESQALTNKSAALKKGGTVGEKAFHESGVLQSNQLAPYFVATGNSKRGFQSHVDPDQIVGRSRQSTRAKETSKVEQSSFLAKQTTMDTEENRTAQNDRVYTDGPEILGNVASGNSRRQRILRNIVPPVKRFGMKSEEDDQRNVVLPYDQRNNQVDQETQKVKQHYTVVMNPSRNGIPQPELNIQTEPDQPSMQPVRSNSVGRRGLGNRLALPTPEARPPSNAMKITRSESTQPSRPTGKKPTSTLQNFVTQVPQRDITKSVKTPPPLITDEYLKTEPASRTQDGPRRSSNSRPNEENTNTRASIRKTESNRQFRIKPIGTDLRSQSPKSYDPSPLLPSDKLNSVNPYYMAGMLAALKNPDETDYFNKIYRDHFSQTHQAMSFCRSLRAPDSRVLAQKRVMLSKREDVGEKKCLIFDLDETLVHCNENSDDPAEVHLPISFPGGETVEVPRNISYLITLNPFYSRCRLV